MLVVGLDTASNRWHAMSDQYGAAFCSELKATGKGGDPIYADPDERRRVLTRTFRTQIHGWLGWCDEVYICAEEPLALQNGKTTRMLSLAAGALWDVAEGIRVEGANIVWVWADVALWKRIVIGNGNADKDKIRAHIISQKWPGVKAKDFDKEPDLWDAHGLMQLGLQCLTLGVKPSSLALPKKPRKRKAKTA